MNSAREAMEKEADLEEARQRRLPPHKLRSILLEWLDSLKLPVGCEADSWEDLLQEFPVDTDCEHGLQMLFAVRLATRQNRYLITVMRNLSLDRPEIGTISAHVNWQPTEKRIQATVERTYTGDFDDLLRAKHTLWAQTFGLQEFKEALNRCAMAILSKELTVSPDEPIKAEAIPWCQPVPLRVPKPIDDES